MTTRWLHHGMHAHKLLFKLPSPVRRSVRTSSSCYTIRSAHSPHQATASSTPRLAALRRHLPSWLTNQLLACFTNLARSILGERASLHAPSNVAGQHRSEGSFRVSLTYSCGKWPRGRWTTALCSLTCIPACMQTSLHALPIHPTGVKESMGLWLLAYHGSCRPVTEAAA